MHTGGMRSSLRVSVGVGLQSTNVPANALETPQQVGFGLPWQTEAHNGVTSFVNKVSLLLQRHQSLNSDLCVPRRDPDAWPTLEHPWKDFWTRRGGSISGVLSIPGAIQDRHFRLQPRSIHRFENRCAVTRGIDSCSLADQGTSTQTPPKAI